MTLSRQWICTCITASKFLHISVTRKLPRTCFRSSQFPCREPQETAGLLSVSTDWPAPDTLRNGVARCMPFIWLFQAVWRFWSLCVVAYGIFSRSHAEQCSTMWTGLQYTLSQVHSLTASWRSFHPPASCPPCLLSPWNRPPQGSRSVYGLPGFGPWGCNLGTLHSVPPPLTSDSKFQSLGREWAFLHNMKKS